jgi:hypothetical protein
VARAVHPGGEAWRSPEQRRLAVRDEVTPGGVALRQRIEDVTDRLTTLPWVLLGADVAERFALELEPPCELLLTRVDETAGPSYRPASPIRRPAERTAPKNS